jgi:hypothetical protein
MTRFNIVPADICSKAGWVVKTTHDSGVVDTSIVYASQAKAQAAADSWEHLDEDWNRV